MIDQTIYKPQRPFLMMNRYYIWSHDGKSLPSRNLVGEKSFKDGKFKEGAWVIDVACCRYDVVDVISEGIWLPSAFPIIFSQRLLKVKYIFGPPNQLSFGQAREEVINHVISHRWAGQTGATPKQWREMRMRCQTMAELIKDISFYGRDVY